MGGEDASYPDRCEVYESGDNSYGKSAGFLAADMMERWPSIRRDYHDFKDASHPEGCPKVLYVTHSQEEACGEFARFLAVKLREMSYNVIVNAPDDQTSRFYNFPDRLAVLLVLSDGFFKNQHCLIDVVDLNTAQVPLIPLFYRLSMSEFRNEKGRELWREEWKSWKKGNDMARWEQAVKILDSCQGIEYGTTASSIMQYVQAVAEAVCRSVPLQVYWSKESSQVEGRIEMCERVDDSFQRTTLLGLWGIWGVGKSALGKALCDFYSPEFGGRVCYVELGSTPLPYSHRLRLHRLRQILEKLFEISDDFLKGYVRDVGQAHAHLDYCLGLAEKKVFLVVDNIQDSPQSFEQATDLFVRKVPFPEGSKVLLLARSSHTLEKLLQPLNGNLPYSVEEFPRLSSTAYYPILSRGLSEFAPPDDLQFVLGAICESCHPLTIQSVAGFMLRGFMCDAFKDSQSGFLDKVFETLLETFRLLNRKERQFFLDVALFMPSTNIRKLRQLHDPPDELFSTTSKCIRKLRSEALLTINGREVHMPAVCRYFAHWMVRRHLSEEMIYLTATSGILSSGDLIRKIQESKFLQRVAIVRCTFEADCTLDLSSCKYLRVLRLWGNKCFRPPYDPALQKLTPDDQIKVQLGEFSMLESLEILCNMCRVAVTGDFSYVKCFKGDAGVECSYGSDSAAVSERNVEPCLQVLEIYTPLEWYAGDLFQHFGKCHNLDVLRLRSRLSYDSSESDLYGVKSELMEGGEIDLNDWINLSELVLEDVKNLKGLCSLDKLRHLRVLHLSGLIDLVSLSGTEALTKLREFHLLGCNRLSYLRLPASKVLSHCCIYGCTSLKYIEVMEVEAAGQSSDYNEEDDEELNEDRLWLQYDAANWWISSWDRSIINLDSLQSRDDSTRDREHRRCFRFDICPAAPYDLGPFNYGDVNKLSIYQCPYLRVVKGASKLTAIQVFEYSESSWDMRVVTALDVSSGRSSLFST